MRAVAFEKFKGVVGAGGEVGDGDYADVSSMDVDLGAVDVVEVGQGTCGDEGGLHCSWVSLALKPASRQIRKPSGP